MNRHIIESLSIFFATFWESHEHPALRAPPVSQWLAAIVLVGPAPHKPRLSKASGRICAWNCLLLKKCMTNQCTEPSILSSILKRRIITSYGLVIRSPTHCPSSGCAFLPVRGEERRGEHSGTPLSGQAFLNLIPGGAQHVLCRLRVAHCPAQTLTSAMHAAETNGKQDTPTC